MITDIFARRYAAVPLRSTYFQEDARFMVQAAVMIGNPLWVGRSGDETSELTETGLREVHDTIALELGRNRQRWSDLSEQQVTFYKWAVRRVS